MLDLFLLIFVLAFIGAGFRRPFIFVLAYTYIDVVSPQKVSWGILAQIPISLIAFLCAFGAWFVAEDKNGTRFSLRQFLMLMLLIYCGMTTQQADFPIEAAEKWSWVWKALVFAMFLPVTLRTRLRIEALTLFMVLSIGVIVIGGGIKTITGGGGYGNLRLLVDNNTGLYESSIISAVSIAVIPLALWLARFGTIFPPDWRVKTFAWALCFACALMPIGTGARTGLVCVVVLAALILRTAKRRMLIVSLMAAGALVSLPLLPAEFVARMSTIGNHQ
ncbi:MAG: putative O-glycosylation ligase, exosortase A system-associated, partial [Novosphingobium sp. 16-62-11]